MSNARNLAALALQPSPHRNKLVNGRFDIWQRGGSFDGTYSRGTYYGPDRWQIYRAGGAAGATFSRIAYNGPNALYALRMQRDSGNTGTGTINAATSLESIDVYMLKGKTVTLSFRYLTGANFSGGVLVAAAYYGTGTDGSMASGFTSHTAVPGGSANLSPSTTQQLVSLTFVVPSNASQFGLNFGYVPAGTAGAADFVEITNVQLEIGNVATDFEHRPIPVELLLCQRMYEVCYYRVDTAQSSVAFFGSAVVPYRATKRLATPTTARLSESVTNCSWNSTPATENSAAVIYNTTATAGNATGYLAVTADL